MSTRRWTDEEIEKMNAKTYTYTNAQGEEQTVDAYEASQILRRLERRVRDIKRRLAVEESKGDLARPEEIIKLKRERAIANKKIANFVEQTGLKRAYFRERIAQKP